ncbi:MCE family protein [Nocardioides sp. KC13]|uniref:MCE family protein n=1 Tax=Nocardioides turkmenicus TaxID=2711220 RepID=A0A6M1QWB0_9ACTN|nr:MCE family protein [Nocardioides sp. KC13]NGN94235.1 MCE family protein [Nocardioides sp. KC13]
MSRATRPQTLAVRGAAGVLACGLLAAGMIVLSGRPFSDDVATRAAMVDVGASLRTGSDVKMGGVIIGTVTGISRATGSSKASVAIRLDGEAAERLPADVAARALPATVFGTAYVDLVSTGAASGRWRGGTIPQDLRQGTVELQQALDSIDELVKAVSPADLNAALAAVAGGLDGRGDDIARTLELAANVLERAEADLPTIRSTASLLAVNLETLEASAGDLFAALESGTATAETIAAKREQLVELLSGGLTVTAEAQRFLDEHGAELVTAMEQAAVVADALYDNRENAVVESFRANREIGQEIPTVIGDGRAALDLILHRVAPPYYTRERDCPTYGNTSGDC